jgi:hypothetical protein
MPSFFKLAPSVRCFTKIIAASYRRAERLPSLDLSVIAGSNERGRLYGALFFLAIDCHGLGIHMMTVHGVA